MRLDYHDLSEDQFEHLVLAICTWLLGPAVQGFSKGPDGSKDARFHGRAERFPSAAGPWDGRIIIQAKHTELIYRKFSDKDFSGDAKSSVLSKEILRGSIGYATRASSITTCCSRIDAWPVSPKRGSASGLPRPRSISAAKRSWTSI